MKRVMVVAAVLLAIGAQGAPAAEKTPWWKQQKIRFMWGCWAPIGREVPREVIRNVAQSGGTVFAELWTYIPADARIAKEYGMRYFAGTQARYPLWDADGRAWINEKGEPDVEGKYSVKCPLEDAVYERWLVNPHLDGAREGIVDGISVDWEAPGYASTPCYCDDCFGKFLESRGIKEPLPEKAKRFEFLKDRGLMKAYEDNFHQRRFEMLTRLRKKLQAVNPDFLFASYDMLYTDFTRAMSTPETPFIILDARHYYYDDRKPWWDSYGQRLRQEGYLYIPGGWDNALFGSQPSQVSAAQWIYETSINEDGCWMWFEHELTNDMLRAYSSADRRIRTVQDRVGKYLFNGKRDPVFVTATEWSGRPELEQAVIHCTYHLGNEHLAQINNVNADWPLRVLVRFPRLEAGKRWTVRDAMGEQFYTRDGKSAVWTTADLLGGVVAAMEPRSDLFLLVSPAQGKTKVDPSRLMYSRAFEVHPMHASASAKASVVKGNGFSLPKDGWVFKMDKEDLGVKAQWFLPTSPLDGWAAIETEIFWGGKGDVGAGWYRRDVDIPAQPDGKPIYLHFGAVDEELMLWIDGKSAGEHDLGPVGWDKPFAIDVTGKLTAGKHHIAMRVYNSAAAGGIWKPVSVTNSPDVEGEAMVGEGETPVGPSGRMVYTSTERIATEQMAFEGGCGVGTLISNTIHTVNGDGTKRVRVRQLHGELWSPSYSPDAKRIVFVHDTACRGQIYSMNADGSDAVNISNNSFCDRSPVWSPDGSKIVFLSDRQGDWDVYVVNSDGSGQRRLAGNPGLDRAPAWSPDGTRLAWESHVSGLPSIWVCDADGRNPRSLITPDKPLKIQEARTYLNPPAIVDIKPVFPDNTFYLTDKVWSPDGKRIACAGLSAGTMVAVLEADGSRMLQVIPSIAGAANVRWSPDGTKLAGTLRTAPGESERSGIFVVKADGTADYRWLVDVTPRGPRLGGAYRPGLNTWYSSGSAQPRRVVKTFESLTWSPDGKTLAFSSDMDPTGAFYVYTMPAEGGAPTRLDGTMSAWPNEVSWRPR